MRAGLYACSVALSYWVRSFIQRLECCRAFLRLKPASFDIAHARCDDIQHFLVRVYHSWRVLRACDLRRVDGCRVSG